MIKDKFWVEIWVEEWEATWVVEEEWVGDLEDLCEDLKATRAEEITVPHIAVLAELCQAQSKFRLLQYAAILVFGVVFVFKSSPS